MYILFEGIDTTGKSTQIKMLKDAHPEILATFEPGATDLGEKIREILLTGTIQSSRAELLLFLADRAEHYDRVIAPNMDKTIISDRGFLSGIGYALASNSQDLPMLLELNKFALQNTLPDKIIMFTTNLDTLNSRISKKDLDTIELRGSQYLMDVQEQMISTLQRLEIPFIIIDSTQSMESIHKEVLQYLHI